MKTINRHSRIVISLLMVLVMLFSTVAVTAFAETEQGNGTQTQTNPAPTVADTDWYTFTYTPPKDGAAAKLDVQIKTDISEYWNIGKADVIALVEHIIQTVQEKYGVTLERELKVIGEDE